jgi:hypothetical protein
MRRLAIPFMLIALCATVLSSAAAGAQELGRLFTSPQQRESLERMRRSGKPEDASATSGASAARPAEPALAIGDRLIVVNGVVTRSGSKRATIWLDDVAHDESARRVGGVAMVPGREQGTVALTLRSGRKIGLKAGQSVDAVSGTVTENTAPAR